MARKRTKKLTNGDFLTIYLNNTVDDEFLDYINKQSDLTGFLIFAAMQLYEQTGNIDVVDMLPRRYSLSSSILANNKRNISMGAQPVHTYQPIQQQAPVQYQEPMQQQQAAVQHQEPIQHQQAQVQQQEPIQEESIHKHNTNLNENNSTSPTPQLKKDDEEENENSWAGIDPNMTQF
ncbi:hypothetical protein [Viridibacillus arvi]|uniref:hypothetical protein n=1 Tax=Viridibacillus arvi TaxID=263475 RepID=UPI0034CE0BB3